MAPMRTITIGSESGLELIVSKYMQIHGFSEISRNDGCLSGCSQVNHLTFFFF